jgi:hypothetical protein
VLPVRFVMFDAVMKGVSRDSYIETLRTDPSAYFVDSDLTHHVFYTAVDGRLYELRWSVPTYPGAVSVHDLAPTRQAPPAASNPSAYYNVGDSTHHVIYRAADNHVHELQWGGTPLLTGRPTIKQSP